MMTARLVFVGLGVVSMVSGGCEALTKPNPLSCLDGYCSDQAHPFCDVDGSFSGKPGLCIAVECDPLAFETCRGDDAIVCNATGDDYDITHCATGCTDTAGGCALCVNDSQCANPSPHCDLSTSSCRGCISDNECASEVCNRETGSCADPTRVVYASPSGSIDPGCGTATLPCSIANAFRAADTVRNIVKLRPGSYTVDDVLIWGPDDGLIHGYGALVSGRHGIRIEDNRHLVISGLSTKTTDIGGDLQCATINSGSSSLVLDDATISPLRIGVNSFGCILAVRASIINLAGDFDSGLYLNGGSTATVERTRCTGAGTGVSQCIRYQDQNSKAIVTNSIFEKASAITMGAVATRISEFSFSTFVDSPIQCATGAMSATFSNNLLYGTTSAVNVTGTACSHDYALVTPHSADPPGGTHFLRNVDPNFVNAAGGDYHVRATSPVIDAASAAVAADVDFDGTPRPQGAGRDLGAFEFKP